MKRKTIRSPLFLWNLSMKSLPVTSLKQRESSYLVFQAETQNLGSKKIEQYYSFHKVSEQDKLIVTSFHLDGVAEEWFLWLSKTNRLNTSTIFIVVLCNAFGPSKNIVTYMVN